MAPRPWRVLAFLLAAALQALGAEGAAVSERRTGGAVDESKASVFVELDGSAEGSTAKAKRERVRSFATRLGATVRYEYRLLPGVLNLRDVPREALDGLAALSGVGRVVEDPPVSIQLVDSVKWIGGLQSDLAAAGLATDGAGVRICVVDTGIFAGHALFARGQVDEAAGYDFYNQDSDPTDDHGHGTHVAAIAAGRAVYTLDSACSEPRSLQGVAPAARLIAVKVLSATGKGRGSDIVAGIERCASPLLPGGPAHVINLSLSGAAFYGICDDDFVAQAANRAAEAGLVVVAAVGNGGLAGGLTSPACGSRVIAVGATYDATFPNCEAPEQLSFTYCLLRSGSQVIGCVESCTDDRPRIDDRACFSNRSYDLDVTAPGCQILSADLGPPGNRFVEQCGTSMATAHVAGLAALLRSFHPALEADEVRELIRRGTVDLGPPGYDSEFGFGRIDVQRSLALVEVCDDLDNDADGAIDERCVCRDPADADGDGLGNACDADDDGDGIADDADCAPLDPGVHALPEEVAGVAFGPDKATLSWDSVAPAAGQETVYDLRRGAIDELVAGAGGSEICLEADVAATTAFDASAPLRNRGFWYRIRGRNRCGAGSFGDPAASGLARIVTALCP